MATQSNGSIWFSRLLLGVAVLLFVRIGIGHIVDPIGSVASQQITLGSPAGVTVMRVSGGVFMGIALVLVPSIVSERRLLAGVGRLMTIAITVTAIRLLGLAIDGSAPFTLKVLKPEIALVVFSTVTFLWERRRRSGAASHLNPQSVLRADDMP